jgi:hypothetical protein
VVELKRGDLAVLCSKGLSGKVDPEEIAVILQGSAGTDEACRRLIDLANQRGGKIILRLLSRGSMANIYRCPLRMKSRLTPSSRRKVALSFDLREPLGIVSPSVEKVGRCGGIQIFFEKDRANEGVCQ